MAQALQVSIGQFSDKGAKTENQDFCDWSIPTKTLRRQKGITLAIADGISSSSVSALASEQAVKRFLQDYYCTSDAWSVLHSAQTALQTTNTWLCNETKHSPYRYDKDKGYVCTFSALILKAQTATVVHIGDSRIYKITNGALEQLTNDHRLWTTQTTSYLSRALGIEEPCNLDCRDLTIAESDTFVLMTDGVYEYVAPEFIIATVQSEDANLNAAAQKIAMEALNNQSNDNLSIQIVRVDQLPRDESSEVQQQIDTLKPAPQLQPGQTLDGFYILKTLYDSARSHVYLAKDISTEEIVVLKTLSTELGNDPKSVERFLMEEWIGRRINNPYVQKIANQEQDRHYLYTVYEFIPGQTLAQWIRDNPSPSLETVRNIIEQVAKGLRAFHRMDMLHQDIRPENIMIDEHGRIKIVDFGSTYVSGIAERIELKQQQLLLGTALFSAPEYFLGEPGSQRSDLFSLGVLTYFLLGGRFPYGTKVAGARTLSAQRKLRYQSVLSDEKEIPSWVDEAIRKAVHPNPLNRYSESSEFIYDLRHPNQAFLEKNKRPLMERNPVLFWQLVSAGLSIIIILLLYQRT